MQIGRKQKSTRTSSHDVRLLFMLSFSVIARPFACALISMLNGWHVTGSWKCAAQSLHQMVVKQHTKLPVENALYDDGLFSLCIANRRSVNHCQLDRATACLSAFQCQSKTLLFTFYVMF